MSVVSRQSADPPSRRNFKHVSISIEGNDAAIRGGTLDWWKKQDPSN
jgi:hypothetical protein